MPTTLLFVPGFHGSGPNHWQSWMESQVSGARRVAGIDWESPVLSTWAAAIRREILAVPGPVWLVAHSFGCLAAVAASEGLAHRLAGALLVAPADPDRFSPQGLREDHATAHATLTALLPRQELDFPTLVVVSSNDPWMTRGKAAHWQAVWGSQLIGIGPAGHINAESGFGPWPAGLALLRSFQSQARPRQRRWTLPATPRPGHQPADG
jgi:uncharacterized protein